MATDRGPRSNAAGRAALAHFPTLAGLPADFTAQEARAALIRDLTAAGKSLRWIGKVLGCTIAEIREDLADVPRARPPGGPPMGTDRGHAPGPIPYFGCGHHIPARTSPERQRTGGRPRKDAPAGPCPTCGDAPTEGSPFVCMRCQAVSPGRQSRLDAAKVAAVATREPEKNLMRRSADGKLEWTGRSILSVDERAELVSKYPALAPAWLDSIGQPPAAPAPRASPWPLDDPPPRPATSLEVRSHSSALAKSGGVVRGPPRPGGSPRAGAITTPHPDEQNQFAHNYVYQARGPASTTC